MSSRGQIVIPIDINGTIDMEYDTFSTEGCLTDYFETKSQVHSDNWTKQYTIELTSSVSGTSPELEPSYGPIIKLYFDVPWTVYTGQEDTVVLGGYSSYEPSFNGSVLNYTPVTFDGIVTYGCCLDRGNVDHIIGAGGPIDVSDLTYLVAYLFTGGPPPPCEEEGNVDGITGAGGPIDVSDLTYLVAYLFTGGPTPPPC